jgi:hypothetical protein
MFRAQNMRWEGAPRLLVGELVNKFTISGSKKFTVIYALPYGSGRP